MQGFIKPGRGPYKKSLRTTRRELERKRAMGAGAGAEIVGSEEFARARLAKLEHLLHEEQNSLQTLGWLIERTNLTRIR